MMWSNPCTGLDSTWGFQEVEAPRFEGHWHMKVVGCQSQTPAIFTPRRYYWYSFVLESESTPRQGATGMIKLMKNPIDTIGNRLVTRSLTQLSHRVLLVHFIIHK
jgi:hypothetical protein